MGKVLFVSQNPLGRCENLTAVWDAYDGEKEFKQGQEHMRSAERDGYSVVVCDALPQYIDGKSNVKSVNIGHGITGDKLYGADEKWKPWFDEAAAMQTDYAIVPSETTAGILARQLCIPVERVLPLGMPRTDWYFRTHEKITSFFGRRVSKVYFYAPTFRYERDGRLPRIDWRKVDSLLDEGELMIVKRHYFTERELTRQANDSEHPGVPSPDRHRVVEVPSSDSCGKYIQGCDVLVTDYSSIMFDAYLAGVPSVLTVDDKDIYLRERGMYFEYPGFYSSRWLNVEGNEELFVEMMREAADNGMGSVERAAIGHVAGACDGKSTERVCELIRSIA